MDKVIKTERLILRPWKLEDVDDVVEVLVKIARRSKNRKLYNYNCIDYSKCIYKYFLYH